MALTADTVEVAPRPLCSLSYRTDTNLLSTSSGAQYLGPWSQSSGCLAANLRYNALSSDRLGNLRFTFSSFDLKILRLVDPGIWQHQRLALLGLDSALDSVTLGPRIDTDWVQAPEAMPFRRRPTLHKLLLRWRSVEHQLRMMHDRMPSPSQGKEQPDSHTTKELHNDEASWQPLFWSSKRID